jgi:uncharacterized membrane protein YcaP (DUF421 family)
MDKSAIELKDLQRILFGNAPVEFLAETLIRTIVIYISLLFIVRMLGKRMSGQLTITELGIAIMLGAIVAPPMETPERGILQGVLILLLILFYHQGVALLGIKRPDTEKITRGNLSIFVKNGILQLDELKEAGISRAELFARLREQNVYNLGKVKRMYMEANGTFSVYKVEDEKPGLSLLPPVDAAVHEMQKKPPGDLKACISCGNTAFSPKEKEPCKVCGESRWDPAVL